MNNNGLPTRQLAVLTTQQREVTSNRSGGASKRLIWVLPAAKCGGSAHQSCRFCGARLKRGAAEHRNMPSGLSPTRGSLLRK